MNNIIPIIRGKKFRVVKVSRMFHGNPFILAMSLILARVQKVSAAMKPNGKQFLVFWVAGLISVMLLSCAQRQDEQHLPDKNADVIAKSERDQAKRAREIKARESEERVLRRKTDRQAKTLTYEAYPMALSPPPVVQRENYATVSESSIMRVRENPLSTFSIDVDTASYSNVRRFLESGQLPPSDAIRLEEMINYFSLPYASDQTSQEKPFQWTLGMMPTPWQEGTHILRLGLQAFPGENQKEIANNLVFLIDVSGSMAHESKLPLVKKSIQLLTKRLAAKDRIALVVYAGASGVVLKPTAASDHLAIDQALEKLQAGGSTNGGEGIQLAYKLAQQGYIKGGNNRVILATDGDFNVGMINHNELIDLVTRKKETGIYLTTLGFGRGNYNDHLMEQLANKGNGNYAYIDSLKEAKRVLVDRAASSLLTIAKDVKVQVEFNPAVVAEYRLLGYQNRTLNAEDFKNDKVDAGEVGVGHSITALYEVSLVDNGLKRLPELRYQSQSPSVEKSSELGWLKLAYKDPNSNQVRYQNQVIQHRELLAEKPDKSMRFVTSVAGFSMWLRNSAYLNGMSIAELKVLAQSALGVDRFGADYEVVGLMDMAQLLQDNASTKPSKDSLTNAR